ncbi:MAG: sfuC [Peptococcaceae bacterium]|jgi:iron(III) transport system ATP-binding protein|nr:sfuC [Peptococcaceae bacterium]
MKVYLNNVTKTYNHRGSPAVNNISFTVEEGEILSLLGPSGCGKTTTLRLLAGFEVLDSGLIYFDQELIASQNFNLPPEERNIGMVFQDYALFPHLNVFENITFGLRDKKIKHQECEKLLRLVNLTGFEKRYPHELSGGQQQRIALARALSTKPGLILMDEPFSNLDTFLKKQMREEIKRIVKNSGVSAVIVTHDPEDALVMADKIIIMKNGIIEQQGPPQELYERPATEFVAGFLGKANILDPLTGIAYMP